MTTLPARFRLGRILLPEVDQSTGTVLHGFETKSNALEEDRTRIGRIVNTISEPLGLQAYMTSEQTPKFPIPDA